MTATDTSEVLRAGERAPRLVLRFAIFTAVGLALAAGAILVVVRQAYTMQAERQAIERTRLTVDAVLAERLQARDLTGPISASRRRQLDRLFGSKVLIHNAVVGTLYSASGRVTYSTDRSLVGTRARTGTEIEKALTGQIASQVATSGSGRVLTTDVPVVIGKKRVGGVIAIDQDYEPIAAAARRSSFVIAGVLEVLLLSLLVILVPALARASRRIRHHLDELDQMATHDELTGLSNRIGFRRIAERMKAAEGTVLLVDIDGFHEINNALGSRNGDLLLGEVAKRLRTDLSDQDCLARVGEDEFAVLLPTTSRLEIDRVSQKLRESLQPAPIVDGVRVAIDVNIGAARVPSGMTDLDSVLRRAGVALTTAKENHTGLEVYDVAQDHADLGKLHLRTELREALVAGQLVVHYQPQADFTTHWIRGAEALIRWQHPERGLLTAGEFIPLAERTGLITEIGRFVLEDSARQWQHWNARGLRLDLAVNLTAVDLLDAELPNEIETLLKRHSIPPEYLVLEITERTLLRDERRTTQMLNRLSEIGVRLAIDDYGTGYSSLSYLHRLPIQQVKLDRSFTTDVTANASSEKIVRSTIELAHALGATVVAEGVETPEQWHHLANLGCDIAQGYLIGKSLTASELERRLLGKPNLEVAAA